MESSRLPSGFGIRTYTVRSSAPRQAAGYLPPAVMPSSLPRAYFVAGTQEPFFLENARRWAVALGNAGADVVINERAGSHGGAFWRRRVPIDGGVGVWTMIRLGSPGDEGGQELERQRESRPGPAGMSSWAITIWPW